MSQDITQPIIAVLGAGNMGTAIAKVLAENGHVVHLWNWIGEREPLHEIQHHRENKRYLPGIKLPEEIIPLEDIEQTVTNAKMIVLAVPSHAMTATVQSAAHLVREDAIFVNVAKGLDPYAGLLMPTLIRSLVTDELKDRIVSLSGPAIANQLALGQFTAMNIAGYNDDIVEEVQKVFENEYLSLKNINDITGMHIGGACKNVYAIALGLCDGQGISLNTKAAIMIEALDEMGKLSVALGGKYETVYELAGLGDLIGTSLATESRNRRFGEFLGSGQSVEKALESVGQTVEGVKTAHQLLFLANDHGVKMPLVEMVMSVVEGEKEVKEAIQEYLKNI